MAWYQTGTVAVTNGSATVTGTGTAFVGNVQPNWAFIAPDGRIYRVATVVSATQFTIDPTYLGSNQTGQSYSVFPTKGLEAALAAAVNALITDVQSTITGAGAGRFADGTVSAPGLRFAADENTGMRRKGSDALAFVTGGADRLEVNNAGAVLTGALTGSAVVSSLTDSTAGRLVTPGGMGLGTVGTPPNVSDLDSFTIPSGLWRVISTTPNIASKPTAASSFASLLVRRYDAGAVEQEWTDVVAPHGKWHRVSISAGTAWSAWSQVYTGRSILGTVSQTGGVPTGAIIQRGSNANGEFVRFADGTQICWHTLALGAANVASGALFRSETVTWPFPAAFSIAPSVPPPGSGSTLRWTMVGAPTTSSVGARSLSTISDTGAANGMFMAIGRWF